MHETRVAFVFVTVSRGPLEFCGWNIAAALASVTQMGDGAVVLYTRWFLFSVYFFSGGRGCNGHR